MRKQEPLLSVAGLKKHYPLKGGLLGREIGRLRAVEDVSFEIGRGETLGLVGESGCGKSTVGRCVLRLTAPSEGTVLFDGRDMAKLTPPQLRDVRRDMQVVFQDPFASLNPRHSIRSIVGEPLKIHGLARGRRDLTDQVVALLERVGLHADHLNRFAHEFSGGQRQRIGIARAIATQPKLIICDEPVSALDVSVQAQVVNLLQDLQQEFGLTYLFIAHDLSVVEHFSDRVAVMYFGRLVEIASAKELYAHPTHPYSEALLAAVPIPDPAARGARVDRRPLSSGELPSPTQTLPGCPFHPRCPVAQDKCAQEMPTLQQTRPGHFVACHLRAPNLI